MQGQFVLAKVEKGQGGVCFKAVVLEDPSPWEREYSAVSL